MTNYSLFISDIHLAENKPQLNDKFITWCQSAEATNADAIYILGDFFDAWIGDDDDALYIRQVCKALANLSAADVKIYLMVGNHDFLIGEKFAKNSHLEIITDPTVINLYGEKILLCHGDYLCSDDKLHLAFRRFGTWKSSRWLYHCLPLKLRRSIAKYFLSRSRKHITDKNRYIVEVNNNSVADYFKKYNSQIMIHGHTHKPATHQHRLACNQLATRYVLGCWYKNAEILYVDADGKKELRPAIT